MHVYTRTHTVSVHGGSAYVWGLGREPGPLQPGQASPTPRWGPASPPLRLHSLMPKGIFSSSCQSIMKVHSTSKGISGGGVSRGGPLGAGVQPCTLRLAFLGAGGGRETLGCVRLKVSAGNKKIGVNYYSPHGFPKESGSSSLRPVFLFDGESDKWQAACSDKALLWAQPLSLKPSYYA